MDSGETDTIRKDLATALGAGAVLADRNDLGRYLTDWKGTTTGRAIAVVRPATVEDVVTIVRFARSRDLSLVPQGGNTGLAAGAVPLNEGRSIVVSTERLNRITDIDRVGMSVSAEAGVVIDTLRDALKQVGRDLPISFGGSGTATVGGVVSTNAGGANVLRYGMTGQMVLGLQAVTMQGSVVGTTIPLHKNNAGMNWPALLVGAEGTLAIVTSATLRIQTLAAHTATAMLSVPDVSMAMTLLELARDWIGECLSAFEIMSGEALDRVLDLTGRSMPIDRSGWVLLIQAESVSGGVTDVFGDYMEHIFSEGLVMDGAMASSQQQAQDMWALRESLAEAEKAAGPSAKHDISVPISSLPRFVAAVRDAITAYDPNLKLHVFGHVGDGNLHYNVIGVTKESTVAVNRLVHDMVTEFGGSISAEHGIGQYRLDEAYRLLPPEELKLQERIKSLFDPDYRLNPGKLVRRP
ncbi:oxidoreductase [Primorskyibacter flagellatus]|uniref:Oxidoreductase n=1 Tax=Primorskyibacter flagellatus TaxID=1387277 RepID=A0A917AG36_9RHOB|nr:FAD-binding oxidoreductase [Primorskyibacter flagellatus]GGE50200.1 oxidoreductase [Primorskyibacter flagellatus]